MENSSYFIKNKALFGSYPTQEIVKELEDIGVKYFVNLTFNNEKKIQPYITENEYIHFPIPDRSYPHNKREFAGFLLRLSEIIMNLRGPDKIYIHCKGGHGRSGIVVACLLCNLFGLTPEKSLEKTTMYHSNRPRMREKWRSIGAPQTPRQKSFVYKFFSPIYLNRVQLVGLTSGFSTFSKEPIFVPEIGTFQTIEAAYQAYQFIDDKNYVSSLLKVKRGYDACVLGKESPTVSKRDIFYKLIKLKLEQYEDFEEKLLSTNLKPIHDNIRGDITNIYGKMLVCVRNEIFRENYINKQ